MFKNQKIQTLVLLAAGMMLDVEATGQPKPVAAPAQRARENQQPKAFSFAVYGDSRTMMYLPYKEGQEEKIHKQLVDVFALAVGERTAEAVVKKYVKREFDPDTKELLHIQMPFASKSEVAFLTLDKGWVTEASVEDVKLLPGVRRTIFRLGGGEWVAREMVRDVQTGRARFLVNTGDIVWWGKGGFTVQDRPFWKRVNETVLAKLPPADDEMKAAGLEGRFFPSVGNHEVWGDPKIKGVLNTLPYLKKLGVSSDRLIYKYDFNGVRFINLWTGKYDNQAPSLWDSEEPVYEVQMKQMKEWLDDAKAKGLKKAFIVFHYPVFCRSGFGPIPEQANPHKEIAAYAKDLEFVVWNKLPPELVGKWVVQGGEQDGATFDFYRSGAMVGRINLRGKEGIINAQAAVDGDVLLITTQNPQTRRDETKKQTIKTLSATQLVLQDDQGNRFRMERADNLP